MEEPDAPKNPMDDEDRHFSKNWFDLEPYSIEEVMRETEETDGCPFAEFGQFYTGETAKL